MLRSVRISTFFVLGLAAFMLAGSLSASAQTTVPGEATPVFPPQSSTSPTQVPTSPQPNATLQPDLTPLPQNSFSDRLTQCLNQGAAMGLDPNSLSAYARDCAIE